MSTETNAQQSHRLKGEGYMSKGFGLFEILTSLFILSLALSGFLVAEHKAYQQVRVIHQKILDKYTV